MFASCRAKGKEEGQGQDNSGCIIRVIPTIAHDYVCLYTSESGLFKSVMILRPKLKPESAALEMFGESFVCLFLIYILIFHSSKRRGEEGGTPLSGLYRLVAYRSGDARAAGERLLGKSNEVRRHQLFQEITCLCTFPHVWASIL